MVKRNYYLGNSLDHHWIYLNVIVINSKLLLITFTYYSFVQSTKNWMTYLFFISSTL